MPSKIIYQQKKAVLTFNDKKVHEKEKVGDKKEDGEHDKNKTVANKANKANKTLPNQINPHIVSGTGHQTK